MKPIHLAIIILAGLLVFMQYRLWFQTGGIRDMIKLKRLLAVRTLENDKVKLTNQEIMFQIQQMQQDEGEAETRARSELGMIKKGETFYQIIQKDKEA